MTTAGLRMNYEWTTSGLGVLYDCKHHLSHSSFPSPHSSLTLRPVTRNVFRACFDAGPRTPYSTTASTFGDDEGEGSCEETGGGGGGGAESSRP